MNFRDTPSCIEKDFNMTDYETRLDALKTKYPFSKWIETGLPQYTKKACAACAAIFDTLLHDLGALGEHADEPGKLAAFRKAWAEHQAAQAN